MATYDLTAAGGTTGHPSNGRTPYLVENTIDFSVSGFQPAANDIVQALDIPAESIVMNAGLEVLTAGADSSAGKVRVWAVLCDVSGIDETDHN